MFQNLSVSEPLKKGLEAFDMWEVDNTGLRFTREIEEGDINSLLTKPDEWFALEKALENGATAVYFRRFANRPSIPQVYLYDYTGNKTFERKEIAKLHKKLWNKGEVPMFFILTDTDSRIY